jgi:7-carboxy-7-deazaguanine synthase
MTEELNIKEIYPTLQGEGPSTGRPATFLRLAGCSLRCVYCDSEYTFEGGELRAFSSLIEEIKTLGNNLVVVTGGEPLDQNNLPDFLRLLLSEDFEVELESAGHKSLAEVPAGIRILLDVKTPGSKMQQHFLMDNLEFLDESDSLKFVICQREDFDWANNWLKENGKELKAEVLYSPVSPTEKQEGLKARDLAGWILEENISCRMLLQQHKMIWGNEVSR